jgi:putative ABC transport system ATP-binding protein
MTDSNIKYAKKVALQLDSCVSPFCVMTPLPPATETVPLLQLEGVSTARKGVQGQTIQILTDICCSFQRGELTSVIGPSGGGKSSLIRLINRLEDPLQGRILLAGTDIKEIHPPLLRRRVGMMLQKAYMFEGTVLQNLQQPFRYRKEPLPTADDPEILRCISLARLSPVYLARNGRTLSGGEQQRVNLARALISRPEVLLLDEPTSALDRPTTDSLGVTLQEVCRSEQMAVIIVTHDLRLTGRIADRLIYLKNGRVIEAGKTAELLATPHSPGLQQFLSEPDAGQGGHDGK